MNGSQAAAVCPQCGSSAAVHSISELAGLARMRLQQLQQMQGQQSYQGQQPYQGSQQPGWAAEPQQGPVPGPVPGWAREPQPGRPPGPPGSRNFGRTARSSGGSSYGDQNLADAFGEDLAGLAIAGAAKFIGRAIGRRMQQAAGQMQTGIAARGEAMLRQQIEIAERHPDVCACVNDSVIFLIGGRKVLPMPNLATLTVDQADALVANLRSG